ncbi:GMC family oxidoreductase N-terminal domain-containing protein [Devosia sp. CN2-171]|uniref:GMC family oxidoreductase N-terminal domain-containing protein n=1 Tax=Devosia sp. CN2-171 TaxID=3400909 RepID=UPI003BF7BB12
MADRPDFRVHELDRRQFMASLAAAIAATSWSTSWAQSTPPVNPADIQKTHQALFDLWFPLSELGLPPVAEQEIATLATEVSSDTLAEFEAMSVAQLLTGFTKPQLLPFYDGLRTAPNEAVQAFIKTSGGFGAMPPALRAPLFSFLFEGSAGPVSTEVASILREAYLASIWGLKLAQPLANFIAPPVFVSNPDVYKALNAPPIAPSRLTYDAANKTIIHADGPIEYLVIGSGPGGATVASQLQAAGKRVVLIEKGPFVVWGSMTTRSYPALMYKNDIAATTDNAVIIRSGETLGGGSAVNIDLAFSPLESTVQTRINGWIADGLMDGTYYSTEHLATAYEWVRQAIGTRTLAESELNSDNQALWDGAAAYGADPSLYHLNRFPVGASPSPVNDKLDAARQLLYPAFADTNNPLGVIPDATVDEILFDASGLRATGVSLHMTVPWTKFRNTVTDPSNLGIPPGVPVTIAAENVVLSAGTIGTTRVLLNTAKANTKVANPRIGHGLILHPSVPLLGLFDRVIDLLEGLDSATYVASFGASPGFIYETMSGLPSYGSLLVMGSGKQVYEEMSRFNNYVGFGCMLVDTPSDDNRVLLDATGDTILQYTLSDSDKARFRTGVAIGVRMMFLAGATKVIIPSNENLLGQPDFDPMVGVAFTDIAQADLIDQNLKFIPNRNILTSAHLQATNKMGPKGVGVVSLKHRLWAANGEEVPNVYVMDSSIFPTSVGANPMQSIYTIAKIFSERLIAGIPE